MPIRIYALSQQLKIDSKALVDICVKAGVTGKGSALASLTDAELKKVTDYLASSRGSQKATGTARVERGGGTATLDRVVTREDYVGPAGGGGKPPVVDTTRRAPEPTRPAEPTRTRVPPKREPVVKLAAIPEAPEGPAAPAQPSEPAAQKPIMTLPKEAIRGAQQGVSAPLQQFTRQQDRKRRDTEARRVEVEPAAVPAPEETAEEARAREAKSKKKGHRVDKDKLEDIESDRELAGMASARANRQQSRRQRTVVVEGEEEAVGLAPSARRAARARRSSSPTIERKGKVVVDLPCTVRSFSEATGIPAAHILRALMSMESPVNNLNAELDSQLAEMIAMEAGLEVEFKEPKSLEEEVLDQIDSRADDPDLLQARPPVVTFLGHVDHGKTSLLDRIIGINVVAREAGGITQHIRAYSVEKDGRRIGFVDTPGHEAFTEMRARGANVTDIAVLVIAADDGFMPQTVEALSHARAAGVPIVVALNKIDLPGVDINRVMQELTANDLLPVEWGGDIEVVRTSAVTGEGIDDLLETLLLTAEIHEYRANPERLAVGTCLEAQQEGNRGVVAKLIVKNGTLHVGDVIVCGGGYGRVKAMYDPLDPKRRLKSAGPSIPVNVTGLDVAPGAGESFHALEDIATAREIADARAQRARTQTLSGVRSRVSFEEFQRRLEEGRLGMGDEQAATLNLIIRADVRGSIEAIQKELSKFEHPEVQVRVLLATVGGVTAADVTLADASNAVIVGFNVIPDENARNMADERGVEIRRYDIIYKLTEDIKKMVEGKLKPEEQIQELGRALVQRVFTISRVGAVAGCRVLAGSIERGCRVRVNRDGRGIGDYPLDSLKREKDDAKEVREGYECGMKLSGFNDLKEGDILEAYKIQEVARTL